MDPNNPQQSNVTPPAQTLVPPTVETPTPPPPAPVETVAPPPPVITQSPENSQKSSPLLKISLIVLITAIVVALGYIAYVKFINPPTQTLSTIPTPEPTAEEVQPTDVPQATDSGATFAIPTDNPGTPTDAPVPTDTPTP